VSPDGPDGTRNDAPHAEGPAVTSSWADRIRAGDRRATSGLIRALEDDLPEARAALTALLAGGAPGRVLGITGPAGVGKSTLVDALVSHHRARGEKVAVVAVDPSSPFTGGAILGDRVRMQQHATDPGVFVRSLATRGASGGLARAAWEATAVLAAAGFDTIYLETTGAGQAEIAVASVADAVAVLCVPGLGDDVQTLKGGLLEIADVLVVNKADREGADRVVRELEGMLALRRTTRPELAEDVPVARTVATRGEGIAALAELLAGRAARTLGTEAHEHRARALILDAVADEARRRAAQAFAQAGPLLAAVVARRLDPRAAARAILDRTEGDDTLEG